jgi:hypothetical protein
MSKALVLHDELSGFHPGSEGTAVVVFETGETINISTKYAVEFEDDVDGWEWGLGGTYLNVHGITELRDYLNDVLNKIGA